MVRRADSKLIFAKHGEVPIATKVHRRTISSRKANCREKYGPRDCKLPRDFTGSSQ
jgi:hypothetical protein